MTAGTRRFRPAAAFTPSPPWLGEGESEWLAGIRAAARARLAARGLPSAKAETWRHTNLNKLLALAPQPEAPGSAPALDRAPALLANDAVSARLVFVNGRFNAALSRLDDVPAGLRH